MHWIRGIVTLFGCLATCSLGATGSDVPDNLLALLTALLAGMDTSDMTPACQEAYSQVMYDLGCGDRKVTMSHYLLLQQHCLNNAPTSGPFAN